MRKLLALAFVLAASPALAQQATRNSPVARTAEDNYRAESSYLTRDGGGRWEVIVSVRDSGGVEIRRESYSGPDATHTGATAAAFNTAVSHTVAAGEMGSNARKTDYRILKWLVDQSYLAGVTLVP